MIATINYKNTDYRIDLSAPFDISIPIQGGASNVNAWYIGPPKIEPHKEADFVAKVAEGASINFNNIWFNPHSHGTHTECVGHLTEDFHSIDRILNRYFFRPNCLPSPLKKKPMILSFPKNS